MQSIIKLNNIFCNETKTIEYLIETNIIQIPEKCAICQSKIYLRNTILFCKNKTCYKNVSIFKNTIFFNSNLLSSHILLIGYFFINRIKTKTLCDITGFSPKTIIKYVKLF